MIENGAVFVSGTRRFKGVNIDVNADTIYVLNRINGEELVHYTIVEVVKDGMAWDVLDTDGQLHRLVAQTGCGCSGMSAYTADPTYSGALAG
jgi:hypothetical protein